MNKFYKIVLTSRGIKIKVDIEDYAFLSKHKWGISSSGYAYRKGKANGISRATFHGSQ